MLMSKCYKHEVNNSEAQKQRSSPTAQLSNMKSPTAQLSNSAAQKVNIKTLKICVVS